MPKEKNLFLATIEEVQRMQEQGEISNAEAFSLLLQIEILGVLRTIEARLSDMQPEGI